MPLLEEIFNAFDQAKVFNTLELRFGYHQLPLNKGDYEVIFHLSIPSSMKWLYSEVDMLLVKEKWKMYL